MDSMSGNNQQFMCIILTNNGCVAKNMLYSLLLLYHFKSLG